MDLSVNKSAKEFMRAKFREWYASEVQKQFDNGVKSITPVDLRMSTMKPLGARWLHNLFNYLEDQDSIVTNGFKHAGIVDCLSL